MGRSTFFPSVRDRFSTRCRAEYGHLLETEGIGLNVIHNVGAAQIRRVVLGDEYREPTPEALAKMKGIVAKAKQDGCVEISPALIYPPGTRTNRRPQIDSMTPSTRGTASTSIASDPEDRYSMRWAQDSPYSR